MLEILHDLFSYTFIVRALIVGTLVSLCAAPAWRELSLKTVFHDWRRTLSCWFWRIGCCNGVSLGTLPVAIPVVVVAAFLLLRLSENSKIKGILPLH